MNAQEIIERIRTAEKKTPVRVFLKAREPVEFPHATVFPLSLIHISRCRRPDIGQFDRENS